MKATLLRWLVCPSCNDGLVVYSFEAQAEDGGAEDIAEGILICQCGSVYPITEGVPRVYEGALNWQAAFRKRWKAELRSVKGVGAHAFRPVSSGFREFMIPTMRRFGKEWAKHPIEQDTWGLDQGTRLTHALRYLGWRREEVAGRVVLDAGCGNGKLTCGMATWGAEVIGLDLSPAVVLGWRERHHWAGKHADRVHIVQGDLMRPPFRRASFDGIHASGVLHHTPNTRAAFDAVAYLVRPGGALGVWLYRKEAAGKVPWLPFIRATWASVPVSGLRKVTPRLPPSVLYAVLLVYSSIFHVMYAAVAKLRGRKHEQTIRERTTSLFDSLAPPYVWRHTSEEVTRWFHEAGFQAVSEATLPEDDCGFCVTGRRGPLPEAVEVQDMQRWAQLS